MGGGPESRCAGCHVELKKLQYITLMQQVGISLYFMTMMHGQTTLRYKF
jgi:hypothetical protein